jgi:AcrR family transcriptional regulator
MNCDSILRVTYRRTSKVEERMTLTRERIVLAALELVATHGYGGTTMPMVAATAEVSTGLLYQYFPSKTDLFDEVFRQASQREIDACAAAAASESGAGERLAAIIRTFAHRALKRPKLAWALLAEPVAPQIDEDRLRFREPYRAIFVTVIEDGIDSREFRAQNAHSSAAAIVGALAEAMIGPLALGVLSKRAAQRVVEDIVALCLAAVLDHTARTKKAPVPPSAKETP